MSGRDSRLLGRWGEDRAAEYLRDRGYHILAANWKCRFGEIDLVAGDGPQGMDKKKPEIFHLKNAF